MYTRRSTGAISGLLIILLGAWAAIIPFIGPYFHYAFGSTATWHFTSDRAWLDILPGVVVILGGAMLMTTAHRLRATFASWLAICGGAWLVVGPAVSRLWEHGAAGPIGQPLYGSFRQMLEFVGYFYGVGAAIIGLSAFALGRFVSRPAVVTEPADAEATDVGARDTDARYAETRDASPDDAEGRNVAPTDPEVRNVDERGTGPTDGDIRDAGSAEADARDAGATEADARDRGSEARQTGATEREPVATEPQPVSERTVQGSDDADGQGPTGPDRPTGVRRD